MDSRALRGVIGLLRVDKKFRTYGPEDQKREYHKRPHIEAVYSFLKTQYSLANNKVRGLKNVASYALYSLLCLVLNREAAENINRPDKAVSPTYFNTKKKGKNSTKAARLRSPYFSRISFSFFKPISKLFSSAL